MQNILYAMFWSHNVLFRGIKEWAIVLFCIPSAERDTLSKLSLRSHLILKRSYSVLLFHSGVLLAAVCSILRLRIFYMASREFPGVVGSREATQTKLQNQVLEES